MKKNEDIFNINEIEKHLLEKRRLIIIDEATSSNDIAKEYAKQGEDEGTIIIVKSQTAGRGRMSREFISRSEAGLYMTIILRPKMSADRAVSITTLGATATLNAIEKTSKKMCSVKWVNDIYLNEKKVSGILTEASIKTGSDTLEYAVIGIGVNVSQPEGGFHSSIKDIATSIYDCAPSGYRARLCAEIINEFFALYNKIEENVHMEKYRQRSFIIGKRVSVLVGDKELIGIATGIDDNASLVLECEDGIHTLSSGEARIKK